MHVVFGAGLLGAAIAGALAGPYRAYLWWGTTATFFAMITFLFVNLANVMLHRDRVFASAAGFALHGALPLAGIAVDLFILWRSFFVEQWGQGAMGRSAIAFDVACGVLALASLWPRKEVAVV